MKIINHSSFVIFTQKDPDFFKRFLLLRTFKDLDKFIEKEVSEFHKFQGAFESPDVLKGDIFEIFAEGFFHILGGSSHIGIANYKPTPKSEDNGVDGFGIGMDNKPATIQIKYRSNPIYELTEEDLKQFAFQSIMVYDVEKTTKNNMIVFTSCKGVHWYTQSQVFKGILRTISRDDIRKNIDNNNSFWIAFREIIEDSYKNYFNLNF